MIMKIFYIFVLCLAACGGQLPVSNNTVPPPQTKPTVSVPKDGNYPGKGKVTKIDL